MNRKYLFGLVEKCQEDWLEISCLGLLVGHVKRLELIVLELKIKVLEYLSCAVWME